MNTAHGQRLFTTDVNPVALYSGYVSSFPTKADRQHHTCNCCRRFIETYGGLVTINEQGETKSALWCEEDAPLSYVAGVNHMRELVEESNVNGVFLSSDPVWGHETTGVWHHFFAVNPRVHAGPLLTAGQAMAEKREDFKNVARAFADYSVPVLEQAVALLESDALYRSEKVLGPAQWLLERAREHARRGPVQKKDNLLWRAVASAPAGFCHPRSSMISTLLDDLVAGMNFIDAKRRFAEKMSPLQYQRPQAAPKAGNIAQAEKIVEQLRAAGSLARRYARLEEIQKLWEPRPSTPPSGGVFGHLQPYQRQAQMLDLPPQTITWVKFQRDVLPNAESIRILAPSHGHYAGILTAENFFAPPILQWDEPGRRNPFSWYLWATGSSASQWGLVGNAYYKVNAITLKPSMWNGGYEHQGVGAVFVINGARDTRQVGAALFPEILKSEFHGIRSVIEAYSRSATIGGVPDQSANGLMFQKEGPLTRLRVTAGGLIQNYALDRWE